MINRKNKIIIFGTVMAIVLGFLYWQPSSTKKPVLAASIPDANYYFKQVNLKQFAEDGSLASQLQAEKMSHYSNNNSSNIEQPLVTLISQQKSEWRVSALTGKLDHNNDQLKLNNNVSISQQSTTVNQINTSNLMVNLQEKSATTDDSVLILSENSKTTAIGMAANFSKEEIKLHHQVKTLGVKK